MGTGLCILLTLLFVSLSACSSSCKYAGYDFSSLSKPSGYMFHMKAAHMDLVFDPCNDVKFERCTSTCCFHYQGDPGNAKNCGSIPKWSINDDGSVHQELIGQGCQMGMVGPVSQYRLIIDYKCKHGAGKGTPVLMAYPNKACMAPQLQTIFRYEWETELVCKTPVLPPKGKHWGWKLLIIVTLCAAAYVGSGVAYRKYKLGVVEVEEQIPNVDFWREVPGYVKDGALYSWQKINDFAAYSKTRYQNYRQIH